VAWCMMDWQRTAGGANAACTCCRLCTHLLQCDAARGLRLYKLLEGDVVAVTCTGAHWSFLTGKAAQGGKRWGLVGLAYASAQ
jgi:hypothetical protein